MVAAGCGIRIDTETRQPAVVRIIKNLLKSPHGKPFFFR